MQKFDPNRRKFIQKAALAGVASTLLPSLSAQNKHKVIREKPENGLIFLFQGDSITDGNRGRDNDPNHIMGHGYAFSVASRVGADFPLKKLQFYNRGISGNSVTDLQKRWEKDTLNLKANILSILVGINDVNAVIENWDNKTSIAEFETTYRNLLEQQRKQNPTTLFVLGIPFVYPVGARKENWETWKSEVDKRAKIVRKLAPDFNAIVVDYPTVFDKAMKNTEPDYWIWDGIHPTVFGHELMAREWIRQVSTRLPFLEKYNSI